MLIHVKYRNEEALVTCIGVGNVLYNGIARGRVQNGARLTLVSSVTTPHATLPPCAHISYTWLLMLPEQNSSFLFMYTTVFTWRVQQNLYNNGVMAIIPKCLFNYVCLSWADNTYLPYYAIGLSSLKPVSKASYCTMGRRKQSAVVTLAMPSEEVVQVELLLSVHTIDTLTRFILRRHISERPRYWSLKVSSTNSSATSLGSTWPTITSL